VNAIIGPLVGLILVAAQADGQEYPRWTQLSSKTGDLPCPGKSTQQTGCLVLDIDRNGLNDIVITSRNAGSRMVWYQRDKAGWTIYPIDRGLEIEAGGASADIDGDGDLDIVFGEDFSGTKVYWWENPYPVYAANRPWVRREIKSKGGMKHHDQIFGEFTEAERALGCIADCPGRASRGAGQGRHRRRWQARLDRRRLLVQIS
jgi:FG-GAP-like repeat